MQKSKYKAAKKQQTQTQSLTQSRSGFLHALRAPEQVFRALQKGSSIGAILTSGGRMFHQVGAMAEQAWLLDTSNQHSFANRIQSLSIMHQSIDINLMLVAIHHICLLRILLECTYSIDTRKL